MDQQFEYKNATNRYSDQDLNRFAGDGWELISAKRRTLPIIGAPTDYVFKRLKKDGQPATQFNKKVSSKIVLLVGVIFISIFVLFIALVVIIANLPPEQPTSTPVANSVVTNKKTPAEIAKEAADLAAWEQTPAGKLCTQHPDWDHNICEDIVNKQLEIGMTEEQATLSWGPPQKINTTETEYIKHEQWVYGLSKYLYFDNGSLVAIQN